MDTGGIEGVELLQPLKHLLERDCMPGLCCMNKHQTFFALSMQATVGAGLPVIATLKHLVDTGDRILKVEGIFSGTLSYIFNMFSQEKPFSQIVSEAKSLGYTEPDPRDDLAGMDVARKVTILAR